MAASLPRIVFFALRELHMDVLSPVLRAVAARGRYDVGVVAPPIRREQAGAAAGRGPANSPADSV